MFVFVVCSRCVLDPACVLEHVLWEHMCSRTQCIPWHCIYFLRIAPKFWSMFDPVGISILGFLARFGPFRAIPRPDSDSGRSDLRFQHVRPQQIMKYVISMKFQKLKTCFLIKLETKSCKNTGSETYLEFKIWIAAFSPFFIFFYLLNHAELWPKQWFSSGGNS